MSLELIWDGLLDAFLDSVKLLPFLFLTYLLMEFLEAKVSDTTKQALSKSGVFGPIIGGALGVVPQCGFSAAASNLYSGRVITLGTLLAVYLSTSDEMLPIFLSEAAPISLIWKSLVIKMVVGIVAGSIVDIFVRRRAIWKEMKRKGDPRKNNPFQIKEICEQENCHCGSGHMLKSALTHTIQVWVFILLISLVLNVVIELVGTETLKGFVLNHAIWGPLLAGLIGLIPNCAASVVLTELYLEGAMGFGALMAGLLVGAGVGLLVLARVNQHVKDNLKVIGLLYSIGVVAGWLLEAVHAETWI